MSQKGTASLIYEAEKNPNLIIKEVDFNDTESIINTHQILKKGLDDFMPNPELVLHSDNGKQKISIIMERVNIEPITDNVYASQSLENLLIEAIEIYIKYGSLPDITERNLIYGRTHNKIEPQWYLVDTFPIISSLKSDYVKNHIDYLIKDFKKYYDFLKLNEKMKSLN